MVAVQWCDELLVNNEVEFSIVLDAEHAIL